ncbi:MAG: cytochrome c [Ruegeria sp.]|uniref:c-type cytochrome n=1 Tax=Ruegeria sp. TaxID=1879320 RepID=UPI00349EDCE6
MPTAHEGAVLFADNCTACHGYRGEGGILVGDQTAPDLTRIAARNGGELPRAQVLSQIDGYGRGKVPAEVMPEFGALLQGDLVPVEVNGVLTPTPRPLAALLAYLESIQVSR